MFTRIIKLTAPRFPHFGIRLLKKGSEGPAYGISSKGKPQVAQINRTAQIATEIPKRKIVMLMQVTPAPSQTSNPNPTRTCLVRAPYRSCHQGNITNPCLHFHYIIHSSHISKRCICNCCISTLRVASRSDSRLIRYERQRTEVRRSAHEGLEATSCQTGLGEKN